MEGEKEEGDTQSVCSIISLMDAVIFSARVRLSTGEENEQLAHGTNRGTSVFFVKVVFSPYKPYRWVTEY